MKLNGSDTIVSFSWNVNGIRSALKKGFLDVLAKSGADIFMLQETRAFEKDLESDVLNPGFLLQDSGHVKDYRSVFHPALKAGYSGVALYSCLPKEDQEISVGLGYPEFDSEGRWLELRIRSRKCVYISSYFPNSQRSGARLGYKMNFCGAVLERLRAIEKSGDSFILAGDLNIAHEPIDLANPKQNEKNAGYLPEERQWFSSLLAEGHIDSFRSVVKEAGHYTWWSSRPGVREKNIGWRLDYHIVSACLADKLKSSRIYPECMGSDHCPVSLTLSF